jgi:hypothetical protein
VCRGPPKQPKPSPVKVVAKRSSAGGAAGGNSSSRGRGKGRGRGRGRGRAARPPPGKSKLSIGGKAGPQAAIDINQATAQAYATSQRQAMVTNCHKCIMSRHRQQICYRNKYSIPFSHRFTKSQCVHPELTIRSESLARSTWPVSRFGQ